MAGAIPTVTVPTDWLGWCGVVVSLVHTPPFVKRLSQHLQG